jgi:beta-1,4-mannosyltransferase
MNIYFYPNTTKVNRNTHNPYVFNFIEALGRYHAIINLNSPSGIGILQTARFLKTLDVLLLNWVEDLPDKKGGYIQSLYFFILVGYLKFRNKKVVWILHNKLTHHKKNLFLKRLLFQFLLLKSDIIITHAREGIAFAKSFYPDRKMNIYYFPHPIIPKSHHSIAEKIYDILIWGSIASYKGVDKFLSFLRDTNLQTSYKILIAGKITSGEFKDKLLSFQNQYITIEDQYIDQEMLEHYIDSSKVVLFTYNNESVLSSGALVDSVRCGAAVVGPDTGSFRDLAEQNLIAVYRSFDELPAILRNYDKENNNISWQKIENYCKETSWDNFIIKLNDWLLI